MPGLRRHERRQHCGAQCGQQRAEVRPHGDIGKYLLDQLNEHVNTPSGIRPYIRSGEVWFLGDSPVVGLILCEHEFDCSCVSTPVISNDMAYIHTGKTHRSECTGQLTLYLLWRISTQDLRFLRPAPAAIQSRNAPRLAAFCEMYHYFSNYRQGKNSDARIPFD